MVESLLERARERAEQAEVFWASSQSTPVSFEANRLKSIESRSSSGAAIRIIRDGRIGFASTTNLADQEGLVARALEVLPYGARAAMEFPGDAPCQGVPVYDPAVEGITDEALAGLGRGLVERMRGRWPEVLWDARLARSVSTVRLLNSRGCYREERRSAFSVGAEGTQVEQGDMLFVWEGQVSCRAETDTADLEERLDRKLRWAQRVVKAPTGDVPVVFTPRALAGLLLWPLLAGFNGRNIAQGSSPLVGKLGERLLDPRLTIWDDPGQAMVAGSRAWDAEGVPTGRTALVREGAIASFLFDLQTAGQVGTRSTGSAHRSLGSQPSPGSSVVVVEPGHTPFQEVLALRGQALLVESFLGAGQGNVLGGDFSANVLLGYRVEDGQVVGRVKDTMVAGNVYTAMRELVAIGSDPQWVGGGLYAPTLLCQGVHVSATA